MTFVTFVTFVTLAMLAFVLPLGANAQTSNDTLKQQGIEVVRAGNLIEKGDMTGAKSLLTPLVEAGDADAQYLMAGIYMRGADMAQKMPEILKLLKKSARQGQMGAVQTLKNAQQNGLIEYNFDVDPSKVRFLVGSWGDADYNERGHVVEKTGMFAKSCSRKDKGRVRFSVDGSRLNIVMATPFSAASGFAKFILYDTDGPGTVSFLVPPDNIRVSIYPEGSTRFIRMKSVRFQESAMINNMVVVDDYLLMPCN